MSKQPCPDCGNNPVNHRSVWLESALELIIIPIGMVTNYIHVQAGLNRLGESIMRILIRLIILFKLGHYDQNISRVTSPRAKVLWQEALTRGIRMEILIIGNKATDNYRAKLNNRWLYFIGLPRHRDTPALMWIDDKARLKKFLTSHQINTPKGISSRKYDVILNYFNNLPKPVIIKPRLGSRGRHTTLFINTENELRQAFVLARQLCPEVIIEQQLMGAVYRATVINFQTVGILKGEPPQIIGDGQSTVEQLITNMNLSCPLGVSPYLITSSTHQFLQRQSVRLDTILLAQQKILLSGKIGVSYGGRSQEVTNVTHPEIFKVMNKAARLINDPILGFDFIVSDITRDPSEQTWGIIECNGLPFINLHHDPLIGEPNNIARHVWDIFQTQK